MEWPELVNAPASSLRSARRILIVGGTFDPPHVAHLIQPQLAAAELGADVLLYIPAGRQPQKTTAGQSSPQHRLAMVRLMASSCAIARVLSLEIDRLDDPAWEDRPSYTLDTLQALSRELTDAQGHGPELRMLIGSDQAAGFHTWHRPQEVIALAKPVVMPRPPWTHAKLLAELRQRATPEEVAWWESCFIDMPLLDVSSTLIRNRLAQGLPLAGLVTPAVEDYIHQHRLYRE